MPQRAMRSPAISQGRPVTRGEMGVADLRFEAEPPALNSRKAPFSFLTLVLTSACVNLRFAILLRYFCNGPGGEGECEGGTLQKWRRKRMIQTKVKNKKPATTYHIRLASKWPTLGRFALMA
jgi:hypothetical protein